MSGLAIISGAGDLPRLLAEYCHATKSPYYVVVFEGSNLEWISQHPVIKAKFEQPGKLFEELKTANCTRTVFAGAMQRPKLNPEAFDGEGLKLASILLSSGKSGDDVTLRAITKFFEDAGFSVLGAHDIQPDILPPVGVLTKAQPTDTDVDDTQRAESIVEMLGRADVGQAVVVAQGICLGLESIQGTDVMLTFVATTRANFGHRGILLKAPKPQQDLRVDLPAIGPNTVRMIAKADLAGIVVPHGGVMILNQAECIAEANRLNVFIWVKAKT